MKGLLLRQREFMFHFKGDGKSLKGFKQMQCVQLYFERFTVALLKRMHCYEARLRKNRTLHLLHIYQVPAMCWHHSRFLGYLSEQIR